MSFIIQYPVSMRDKRTNYIYRETLKYERKHIFVGRREQNFVA